MIGKLVRITETPQSTLVASVTDYGAVGDGETDDSAAFNEAFAAIRAKGMGTVFLPTPDVAYRTTSTVDGSDIGMVRVVGAGAKWRPSVGSNQRAFNLSSNTVASIEGIRMQGTNGQSFDGWIMVDMSGVTHATVREMEFDWCLPSTVAGAGVLVVGYAHLSLSQTIFGACGAYAASGVPVARFHHLNGMDLRGVRFTDYRPGGGSAPRSIPWAWMQIHEAVLMENAWQQGPITIDHLMMDEGSQRGLVVDGGTNPYDAVEIRGVRGNIGVASTTLGVSVNNVTNLKLRDSMYAYQSASSGRKGFVVDNVDKAVLDNVQARQGGDVIELGSGVGYAELHDCTYGTLTNNAAASREFVLGVEQGV